MQMTTTPREQRGKMCVFGYRSAALRRASDFEAVFDCARFNSLFLCFIAATKTNIIIHRKYLLLLQNDKNTRALDKNNEPKTVLMKAMKTVQRI